MLYLTPPMAKQMTKAPNYCLVTLFSIALLLGMLTGCSTPLLSQRGPYLRAYHAGDFNEAEEKLDQLVQESIPQNYSQSKEASWILLDRATTCFANGKIEKAIQDYTQALESLDYYGQDLPVDQLSQLMLQDETGAYQAADYEQVLARLYFALALLHQGDESNAYALLRQAEEYQQNKENLYTKVPFTRHYRVAGNGLSKFLFATLLAKRGDHSNARLLYRQAAALIPHLQEPVEAPGNQATILILCHNGNAPYKASGISPGSVASAAALECLLASPQRDPLWSTLTGIPIPILRQWLSSYPIPTCASLDGIRQRLLPFYDVQQAAANELQQKTPVIVARGVARLLLRRCAVNYAEDKDPCLGAMADLAILIINENTRADTRSWTTLPALIEATTFQVEAGIHPLTLDVFERGCLDQSEYLLNLKPNDLCIIHVFNIHPGVRRILISHRYLANPGE
ncbi:hypothetical protein PNK_0755 [Candidatus Protochlamydia naegleriophila]|uniref:Tetratricopeptide repeat protein n=1 Tax=Candidatus Protochlamydia naegleriophila TaxID=389348 RepID=A0A0U5JBA9_9BACT|nr:hypothetical protein [Candidatus Protochlamydia naegleriophila]CUI16381.1 hypothetical protein PNK_0755 [Candidatus Protochlamydia naegleriophila]